MVKSSRKADDDQRYGGEHDRAKYDDAGSARGFAHTFPEGIAWKEKRKHTREERIDAQRQCEEQGKTAYSCHVGEPQAIFSETESRGKRMTGQNGEKRQK